MMVDIACFTDRGQALGHRLNTLLDSTLTRCGKDGPTAGDWTHRKFHGADALIFIGAAGIAVRCIAPHLTDKLHDPAVLVLDDRGEFVISLLSGHAGGANALARRIAGLIGATPVITTATDGAGLFAVDEWALDHGLAIINPEMIKSVSSALLSGRTVRVHSAFPTTPLPAGLEPAAAAGEAHLRIDIRNPGPPAGLWLAPPATVLGLGCRKGTEADAIQKVVRTLCQREGIAFEALAKVCSIDLKRDEPGILEFCRRWTLPFETFSPAELAAAEGDFSASRFVGAVTGVESICDRAVAAGGGTLLTEKTIIDGIALALGVLPYVVPFPAEKKESD